MIPSGILGSTRRGAQVVLARALCFRWQWMWWVFLWGRGGETGLTLRFFCSEARSHRFLPRALSTSPTGYRRPGPPAAQLKPRVTLVVNPRDLTHGPSRRSRSSPPRCPDKHITSYRHAVCQRESTWLGPREADGKQRPRAKAGTDAIVFVYLFSPWPRPLTAATPAVCGRRFTSVYLDSQAVAVWTGILFSFPPGGAGCQLLWLHHIVAHRDTLRDKFDRRLASLLGVSPFELPRSLVRCPAPWSNKPRVQLKTARVRVALWVGEVSRFSFIFPVFYFCVKNI